MPYATLLESRNRGGETAQKAAMQAAAAKTVLNSASQSAKVAVNSAGHSMMAALKKHQNSSSHARTGEESQNQCSMGLKSLWWHARVSGDFGQESQNQSSTGAKSLWGLPAALWKANTGMENTVCSRDADFAKVEPSHSQHASDEDEDEDEDVESSWPQMNTSTAVEDGHVQYAVDKYEESAFLLSDSSTTASQSFLSESEHDVDESEHGEGLTDRPTDELVLEEFCCLGQCGVPLRSRYEVWHLQFGEAEFGDVDDLQRSVPAETARQIDLDVPRTRTQWMNKSDRTTLRRVLRAYAVYDPVVGYCQGMSDIAAMFVLLGFDESASLHGLISITQTCCPGYFCPSLKGYLCDLYVLEVLINEVLSTETVQILKGLDVPLHALAADHLLSLGSHTWPLETVVSFWDLFLSEGSPAVFASFLALLKIYLPKSLQEHRAYMRKEDDVYQTSASSKGAYGSTLFGGGTMWHYLEICDAALGKRNDKRAGAQPVQSFMDGPEQVEVFTKAVSRGVSEDLSAILEQTHQLLPCVPMSRIESLRRSYFQ